MSSYNSFFNPSNMLVVAALLALVLFRHSLFPEATDSTEVKQLMGKVDDVIDDLQKNDTVAEDNTSLTKESIDKVAGKEKTIASATAPASTEKKQPSQDTLSLWQTARRNAWEGNNDAAVETYRALIELQPENYDAYGEMGNVLIQHGDSAGAVEAYSQAALLLGKSGYPQAAWDVMNIVAQLDRDRAQQLHEALYGKPLSAE